MNNIKVASLLLFCGFYVLVSSDNVKDGARNARLFTFNTNDDDISVNLEFSIPFLTIPAKKAINSLGFWSSGSSININPASLAVGGAVVLGTTFLIPFVVKTFAHQYPHQKYSRLLNNAEFSTDAILEFIAQALSDSRTVRGCALRVACWSSKRTSNDAMGIWSQVLSNNLLSMVVNSTSVEDAILSGRKGRECTSYSPCPLRDEHISTLISNLALLSNSVG